MVELVDAPDSKSGSERSVGSIPTRGTNPNYVSLRWHAKAPSGAFCFQAPCYGPELLYFERSRHPAAFPFQVPEHIRSSALARWFKFWQIQPTFVVLENFRPAPNRVAINDPCEASARIARCIDQLIR